MTIPEILRGIKKAAALVVGDICLDRWCTYDPATSEPSAETGIPRLGVVSGGHSRRRRNGGQQSRRAGAGKVAVLGVRGDDGFGFELDRALAERGIDASLMVRVPEWQTFTYTKLLNSQNRRRRPTAQPTSSTPGPSRSELKAEFIRNLRSAIEDLTWCWWRTRRRPRRAEW